MILYQTPYLVYEKSGFKRFYWKSPSVPIGFDSWRYGEGQRETTIAVFVQKKKIRHIMRIISRKFLPEDVQKRENRTI